MSRASQSNPAPMLPTYRVGNLSVEEGVNWTPEKAERAAANNVYLFYGQADENEGNRTRRTAAKKSSTKKSSSKSSTSFRSFRGAERAMAKGVIYIPSILVAGKPDYVEYVLANSPQFIAWAQKNTPTGARFNQQSVRTFIENNAITQNNYQTTKRDLYQQEMERFYRLLNTPKGAYAKWAEVMNVRDVDSYWNAIDQLAKMLDNEQFSYAARKKSLPDENKYARNEASLKERYQNRQGKVLNVSDIDQNSLVGATVTSLDKIMTKGENPTVKPSLYYDQSSGLVSNNLDNFVFAYNLLVPGAPSTDQLRNQYANAFSGLVARKSKKQSSTKKAASAKAAKGGKKAAARVVRKNSASASGARSPRGSSPRGNAQEEEIAAPSGPRGFGAAPTKAPAKAATRKVGSIGGAQPAAAGGKKAGARGKAGAKAEAKSGAKAAAATGALQKRFSVGRNTPQTSPAAAPKSPGLTRVPGATTARQPSVGRTQAMPNPNMSDAELATAQFPTLTTTGARPTRAFMPPSQRT